MLPSGRRLQFQRPCLFVQIAEPEPFFRLQRRDAILMDAVSA
jgi:hypothetical protein